MTKFTKAMIALPVCSVTVLFLTIAAASVYVAHDAHKTAANVNRTLELVNGKTGTIVELNKSLVDLKNLMARSDVTLKMEQASIKQFNAQIGDTLTATNDVLASLKKTSDVTAQSESQIAASTSTTVSALQPQITKLGDAITAVTDATKSANTTLKSVNDLVANPVIVSTLKHADSTVSHVDGITRDFQHALHPILNPDPCKTKGCRVKRAFKSILGAASAGEGLYYTGQIIKEIL